MVVHHSIGSSPPLIHLGVFSIRNGDQKRISEASAAITGVAHCHECVTARKTKMEPEKNSFIGDQYIPHCCDSILCSS